jgi:hypothetical protein
LTDDVVVDDVRNRHNHQRKTETERKQLDSIIIFKIRMVGKMGSNSARQSIRIQMTFASTMFDFKVEFGLNKIKPTSKLG